MPKPNLDERFRLARDYLEKHGKTDENGEKWIDLETVAAIIGGETHFNPDKKPGQEKGYNGYIPTSAFTALSWELTGLVYGTATLTIHIRDGKLARFTTGRERSFMGDGGNGE